MYEDQTENVISSRMMERVSAELDKREGSLIYDASMPAAIEFALHFAVVDYFIKNTFGDTADREYLIERALERGLTPYSATAATVKIMATPTDTALPVGSRYSYDDVNYRITKSLGEAGTYEAVCETPGALGNKPSGRVIPIDYIRGLQYATLISVIAPGEDEEDTETFRARYLASFNTQAYGGNIKDYQDKVNAIPGVSGVKVYPVWNGGGTVKVVIMTSEYKPASTELVAEVQERLDPVPYAQQGVGIAPIGHRVTVESAATSAVNIGLRITFSEGDTWQQHVQDITDTITAYFQELNKSWQDTETVTVQKFENMGLTVRISQIETRLLALDYVTDISHTTLNGQEENLQLADNELATVGTITDASGGGS